MVFCFVTFDDVGTRENSIKALLMNSVHQTLASFFHYGVHSFSYGKLVYVIDLKIIVCNLCII